MPYKDFDEFLKPEEEISFRYQGVEYTIPGTVPMVAVMKASQMQNVQDFEQVDEVLRLILGEENWEHLKPRIDLNSMVRIMEWCINQVMEQAAEDEEDESGDSLDGSLGKDRASRLRSRMKTTADTGHESRQTSGGFTLSPAQTSSA